MSMWSVLLFFNSFMYPPSTPHLHSLASPHHLSIVVSVARPYQGYTVIGCSHAQEKLNSLQLELSSPDRHILLNVDVSVGKWYKYGQM
ncbi:hypothetical protein GOBAR_DD21913 [Gossypium barbadense]|nr:hypothetical protein GOBAR_DD21913 [Gossypium barbadense]